MTIFLGIYKLLSEPLTADDASTKPGRSAACLHPLLSTQPHNAVSTVAAGFSWFQLAALRQIMGPRKVSAWSEKVTSKHGERNEDIRNASAVNKMT
jgi:hypothetical protein